MFPCVVGIIGNKAFTDILLDLVTLNLGTNNFPSSWMHLTQPDVSICFAWVLKAFNVGLTRSVSSSKITNTNTVYRTSKKSMKFKWVKELGSETDYWCPNTDTFQELRESTKFLSVCNCLSKKQQMILRVLISHHSLIDALGNTIVTVHCLVCLWCPLSLTFHW